MYLSNILAAITILIIFTSIITENVYKMVRTTLETYTDITLNAVEQKFNQQCETIKSSMISIYSAQINNELVYNHINNYINRINSTELHISMFQEPLYNYLQFTQKPLFNDASMFFIIGKGHTSTDFLFTNKKVADSSRQYVRYITKEMDNNPNSMSLPLNQKRIQIIPPKDMIEYSSKAELNYSLFDYIRKYDQPSKYIGYLCATYSTSSIDALLEQNGTISYGTTYILDSNLDMVYCSDSSQLNKEFIYKEQFSSFKENKTMIDGNIITTVHNLRFDFNVVNITPEKELYSIMLSNSKYVILLILLFGCLTLLLLYYSTNWLSKRIALITSTINKNNNADVLHLIPLSKYDDELDTISRSYNHTTQELKQLIQQRYIDELTLAEIKLKEKQQQLHILQFQINPHFLYNILEIIRMKAIDNDSYEVANAIKSLAKIFRGRLKDNTYITIAREIEYCENLLNLFCIKFDGELEVTKDIQPEILKYGIIKDLLQPIIENIIVHAFNSICDIDNKIINLTGYLNEHFIIIRISDNGIGFKKEILDSINQSLINIKKGGLTTPVSSIKDPIIKDSIGLINVQERIKLTYGDKCGLKIYSGSDAYKGYSSSIELTIKRMTVDEL